MVVNSTTRSYAVHNQCDGGSTFRNSQVQLIYQCRFGQSRLRHTRIIDLRHTYTTQTPDLRSPKRFRHALLGPPLHAQVPRQQFADPIWKEALRISSAGKQSIIFTKAK